MIGKVALVVCGLAFFVFLGGCSHSEGTLPGIGNAPGRSAQQVVRKPETYVKCKPGYVGTVLCDDPVQYYQLNESSGTIAYDDSSSPHNGTYEGAVTLGATPPPVYGDTTAMAMPGSNGTLDDEGASIPNPGFASGTSWTMETWIYPVLPTSNGYTEYQTIWGLSGSSRLLYGQSEKLLLQLGGGTNCNSTSTIAQKTWTLVDVVYSASAAQTTFYINGTKNATCSFTNAEAALDAAYLIGEYSSTSAYYLWDGMLGEHAAYPTALTQTRIQAHFAAATSSAPATARKWTILHAYEGDATNGGGGYDPGPAEDQAVLAELQGSGFDPGTQDYEGGQVGSIADCPQGVGCVPVGYQDPIEEKCQATSGQNGVGTTVYDTTDADDEAGFTHNSSSIVKTNRFVGSGQGNCPKYGQWVSGGSGQTYMQTFNFHDTSTHSPYKDWATQWPTIVDNDSWKETMVDNFSPSEPYTSNPPHEYTSVADWRATVTKWLMSLGYPIITNSIGPGGGNFGGNSTCTTSFTQAVTCAQNGVIGWAVDTDDICNNIGGGKLLSLISEDPYAYIDPSSHNVVYTADNIPTLANTASHMWANAGCNGTSLEILDYTSSESTEDTNINLRTYLKVAEMLLEPTNYNGQSGTHGIVEWHYPSCVLCSNELAVFPEDELVFVPDANFPLTSFTWGGKSDGNGCQVSGGTDTGGLVGYAQECGITGQVDGGGYYSPVLVREGTCYRQGANIGQCAAVLDTCDSNDCPTITVASLTYLYTYAHAVSLSGAELTTDPNTQGGLTPAGNIPNGQSAGSMSTQGSQPTTLTGCGSAFTNVCAVILTK